MMRDLAIGSEGLNRMGPRGHPWKKPEKGRRKENIKTAVESSRRYLQPANVYQGVPKTTFCNCTCVHWAQS